MTSGDAVIEALGKEIGALVVRVACLTQALQSVTLERDQLVKDVRDRARRVPPVSDPVADLCNPDCEPLDPNGVGLAP